MLQFKKITILLFILFASTQTYAVKVGQVAPVFALPSIDGGTVELDEYKGNVVYLDFWASWCPPCLKSIPLLEKYYKEMDGKPFEIIGVNLDQEKKDASKFLNKHPVSFHVAMDSEGETPKIYDVKAMPTSFILDKKGVVRYVHKGFKVKDMEKIKKLVAELLAE